MVGSVGSWAISHELRHNRCSPAKFRATKRKKHQKQKTLVLRREEAKQAEIQELQQRDAALHLEETKANKRQKEQRRKQNQKRQKCEQKPETLIPTQTMRGLPVQVMGGLPIWQHALLQRQPQSLSR